MAEIINVCKESLPALRVIGKKYSNADRAGGGFGHKWEEWFRSGWFEELEKLGEAKDIENGYLGFMRCDGRNYENTFEYWIGMFLPAGTPVPEGYDSIDVEAGDIAVCWIKGKEGDGSIYDMHEECIKMFRENGMGSFGSDSENRVRFFERYNCPRFTEPDEQGNVILDYGMYLAK